MKVAIVGCGLIGRKRAAALRPEDELVACYDVVPEVTRGLAEEHRAYAAASLDDVFARAPDVVIAAVTHDQLAPVSCAALAAGAHVLVEKPAALGAAQVDRVADAAGKAGRLVKVGFNHRFFPGLRRLAAEVHSGAHGELMHVRGRYGHGGRLGYDREWRADPIRSGGGELIDQGMHLLDLTHWLAGPLPLQAAMLKTQFWDTDVDDNAALLLGDSSDRMSAWAMLHVSWTEWKNTFSLEVYCRNAKLQVDGLVRSYGPQTLRIFRMRPELGPPDVEQVEFGDDDVSWHEEWRHFVEVIERGGELLGTLDDARYTWRRVEQAYAMGPYASMRARVDA